MIEDNLRHFEDLLRKNRRSIGAEFSALELERLREYYHLVLKWNPRLHLTTLIEPSQFFRRHIWESDFAERFISSQVEQVWDLGTGLGVPGIPLAILRPDLAINLVESRRGKVIFLEEVISALKLANVKVFEARIESLGDLPINSCLIARAVEQMEDMASKMFILGKNCRQIILLGTRGLADKLRFAPLASYKLQIEPIPESDRKFVVICLSFT